MKQGFRRTPSSCGLTGPFVVIHGEDVKSKSTFRYNVRHHFTKSPNRVRVLHRDLSCSATTSKKLAAATNDETGPTQRYGASLIRFPSEVQSVIYPIGMRRRAFENGFVLLTKDPGFVLEGSEGSDSIVRLTANQRSLIEEYKQTLHYRLMFRLCNLALLKSPFWIAASLLPCRIRRNGKWEIGWDIIRTMTYEVTRDAFDRLRHALSATNDIPDDVVQAMRDIRSFNEKEYPTTSGKDIWNETRLFLRHCVWLPNGQQPVVSIRLKKLRKRKKITGMMTRPMVTLNDNVTDIIQNDVVVRLSAADGRFLPVSGSWFLSHLSMQLLLPKIVSCVNIERLCRAFDIDEALDTQIAVAAMETFSQLNRKYIALGNKLLRFVTLLNRWQLSDNCILRNHKNQSEKSFDDIRNAVLGERLLNDPSLSEILLDLANVSKKAGATWTSPFDVVWIDCWSKTKLDFAVDPDTLSYFLPEMSAANSFRAFVAICYEAADIHIVWELCSRVDLVQLQTHSLLSNYVEGWKHPSQAARSEQEWESLFSYQCASTPYEEYRSFCKEIGYDFVKQYRFDWATHHPAITEGLSALYGWMTVIGSAALDIFCQQYITETEPELTQTVINGAFNARRLKLLGVDVAVGLRLHRITRASSHPVLPRLYKYKDDVEAIKRDRGTRNYVSTIFHALLGALALDLGLNVRLIMKAIRPIFAEALDASTRTVEQMFYIVERWVPTALEIRRFLESRLKETEYYPTRLLLSNATTGKKFFALYILTKSPLQSFPPVLGAFYEKEDVIMNMDGYEETIVFDNDRHQKLLAFQSEWFRSIQPPHLLRIDFGDQTKKYFVAPAALTNSGNAADDIDWNLINYICQSGSDFLPPDISAVSDHYLGRDTTSELENNARSVLKRDEEAQMTDSTISGDDVVSDAIHKLLFYTKNSDVVRIVSLADNRGEVLNIDCMLGRYNPPLQTKRQRFVSIDNKTISCLPFTLSHFRCLSRVPFVLETMERNLLVEDYRRLYQIPESIPFNSFILAMSGVEGVGQLQFIHLEFLGHSIAYYLYTLDIASGHLDNNVGRMAVRRTQLLRARDIGTVEHRNCLVGHALETYFYPYRQREGFWHPPAQAPYFFDSSPNSNSDQITDSPQDPEMMLRPTKDRLGSGLLQKVSTGLPAKHIKVIVALLFLHEGIEAACVYLNRIGAIRLSRYPRSHQGHVGSSNLTENYGRLQETVAYKFEDVSILDRAFKHSSTFKDNAANYENLEFMGDAVLDLCITKYLYDRYPTTSISPLAELKKELCSNQLFGWISASPPLELHKYLRHKVGTLDNALAEHLESTEKKIENSFAVKIASDIFESLIGAILIDSGFALDVVNRIILDLMKEAFEDLARFGITEPMDEAIDEGE